ncbi:MAG: hypothetical protein QXS85_03830 [Acidilobaceae archaeon]
MLLFDSIALSSRARHVLLDEPFESVDPVRRSVLLREIVSYDGVVLLNTHTTWLLKHTGSWNVYLMVCGRVYGPLRVEELMSSKISRERSEDTLVEISLSEKTGT